MATDAPQAQPLRQLAKVGTEHLLWTRVRGRRAWNHLRGVATAMPAPVPPTDVLSTASDYQLAVAECRRLKLPLHHDRPKNWDSLGAVSTILNRQGTNVRVLDAGAARYSTVLPWLRLLGARELVGNNLEFNHVARHGPVRFEPGDITATQYRDGWFDGVTCLSVVEHGVELDAFAAECARILRPGGLLVMSTDYDQDPIDTSGKVAYGEPVRIFGPADIQEFVAVAAAHGLLLEGELKLSHLERPAHWKRLGLDFTFIRLTFSRHDR